MTLLPADTFAVMGLREDQIRQWASRGHITRYGRGFNGRTLYDAEEVYRHAVATGACADVRRCVTVLADECA